tara:strand:+ start:56 stop:925 length:870 start_codon:yes stop_codon:yes gene_type:complete
MYISKLFNWPENDIRFPKMPECIEDGSVIKKTDEITGTTVGEPISRLMMYVSTMAQSDKYKNYNLCVYGITRDQIWDFMFKKSKGAEIGVKEGSHAESILKCEPKYLYLIDPWIDQSVLQNETSVIDDGRRIGVHGTKEFSIVKNKFSGMEGVKLLRGFSYEEKVLNKIKDGFLDWVYIDGDHTYEGIKKDLEIYDKKLKSDGFFIGHDFVHATHKTFMKKRLPELNNDAIGAIKAVTEFINEKGYYLAFITNELIPSFFIAKDPSSKKFRKMINRIHEYTILKMANEE